MYNLDMYIDCGNGLVLRGLLFLLELLPFSQSHYVSTVKNWDAILKQKCTSNIVLYRVPTFSLKSSAMS